MYNTKQNSFYSFSVALFLYATLIVDLYRKIGGGSVETVRNLFYIISFGFIFVDMVKSKHLTKMFGLFFTVSIIFLVSSLINNGYGSIFISTWILFVSRLLPAYYVGRYTEDWNDVSKYVSKLSWLALLYAIIAIISPYDNTSNAYATIATNLVFVSLISFRYAIQNKRYIKIAISLVCFAAVLFLGTRAVFVGTILSIVLVVSLYINNQNKGKKIVLWILAISMVLVIIAFSSTMIQVLLDMFTNSRTLIMLSDGEMLNDSNRSEGFYSELIYSLETNPFKIYGFLGDRIYLAGNNATKDVIISSFSHNVLLEICMNFGLVLGFFICLYFIYVLFKGWLNSKRFAQVERYIFMSFLGVTFVNMMVSSSYLNSYYIWVLYGFAFRFVYLKTDRMFYV